VCLFEYACKCMYVCVSVSLFYCIVCIHRSSNPCKLYTYRKLNLSYIETIMENYELHIQWRDTVV